MKTWVNFISGKVVKNRHFSIRAVPRSLEVGGQDIGNGKNKCAKRAN